MKENILRQFGHGVEKKNNDKKIFEISVERNREEGIG